VFRDFPTFSRICIFFLLTLLSSNLSLLSASSLLCFSSVYIVGSLTSKLPSISHSPSIQGLSHCVQVGVMFAAGQLHAVIYLLIV